MDDSLKCNITTCRKVVSLDGKAVVTNCSHVFCVDCANSHACLTHGNPYPICPACEQQLTEPDDVVCNSLNPSADYKSSVLSGLPPTVVLEIASRALNFWSYQQQMEANFQAMILKQSQERVAMAERDRDNIEHQAMNEMRTLKERLKNTEGELNHERLKVHEAAETHKVNRKQYEKLKAAYDKLRGKTAIHNPNTMLNQGQMGNTGMPAAPTPAPTIVEPFAKANPVRGAPPPRPPIGRTFGGPQTNPNGLQPGHRHQPPGVGFTTAAQLQAQPDVQLMPEPQNHHFAGPMNTGFMPRGGDSNHSGGSGGGFLHDQDRSETPRLFAAQGSGSILHRHQQSHAPQFQGSQMHRTNAQGTKVSRSFLNATPDLGAGPSSHGHRHHQHRLPPLANQGLGQSRSRMLGTPRPGTAASTSVFSTTGRTKGFRPNTVGLP